MKDLLPGCPQFIAAQGPLPCSRRHFWEMVNQHRVGVIVMVTNVLEADRVKCEQYWPQVQSKQRNSLPQREREREREYIYVCLGERQRQRVKKSEKRQRQSTGIVHA